MRTKCAAFNLFELLAVVAVIAILASAAVPRYRDYILRSRVTEAFIILEELRSTLVEFNSTTNSWPNSSLRFNSYTLTPGSYIAFTAGNVVALRYEVNGDRVRVTAKVSNLTGVHPDYIEPITAGATNPAGNRNTVHTVTTLSQGIYNTYCGSWSTDDPEDVPLRYLPTSCTCTNLQAVFVSGDLSSCNIS